MPVVINELELVVEPPPDEPADRRSPAPTPGPTPADLREVLAHLAARRDRVRAD